MTIYLGLKVDASCAREQRSQRKILEEEEEEEEALSIKDVRAQTQSIYWKPFRVSLWWYGEGGNSGKWC